MLRIPHAGRAVMKNLLSIEALTAQEITDIVKLGAKLRKNRAATPRVLDGQTWALIFNKSSTRTRVSFEVGIRELGGSVMFLSGADTQLGRGEPVKDTARVLGSMVHGAVIRTYAQEDVVEFAKFSKLPTINALTDEEHPCQILADLQVMASAGLKRERRVDDRARCGGAEEEAAGAIVDAERLHRDQISLQREGEIHLLADGLIAPREVARARRRKYRDRDRGCSC